MNQFNQMANLPQRNQFNSYFNQNSIVNNNASTNNIVWVQGIEGAKAWQLNPNSMVILLDSEIEGKMYIKVSDNIGMSTLRIFNYTEEITNNSATTTQKQDLDLSQYVKKDELNNLIKEILTNEQAISTVAATSTAATNQPKVILKK